MLLLPIRSASPLMEQNPTGENRTKKNNNINSNASLKSPYPQKNGLLKKKPTGGKHFPL